MSAIYWSYASESAVCADEPMNATCIRCRQKFYDETDDESRFHCDECESLIERQHESGKEQPR